MEIKSKLETTLQYPDQVWSWAIHELPIDYREIDGTRRCHPAIIGKKLIEFDNHLGFLQLPGNESSTWDLSSDEIGMAKEHILILLSLHFFSFSLSFSVSSFVDFFYFYDES